VTNLREQIETDLSFTLENNEDFGLPVILYGPDGNKQDKSANVPADNLMGQILYDTVRINPDTGEEMVVNNPIVTLRRSSLDRVPVAGETWAIAIPTTPSLTGTVSYFIIDATRAPEGGASIGFIRLYLRKARTPDEIAELIFQDTKDSEWTDTDDTEFIDSP
jgi:hypothetical protein